MRIDAHQHFWNYDARRDSWITEEMGALKRDFLPEDLAPELTANGIAASIAVQADQSEAETNYLLSLAANSERIAGVVGWVDLCAANLEERLRWYSQFRKIRGFRHIVQAEPDNRFLLRPDFLWGVRKLGEFGYVYDILIYPRQLPAAIEFASALPGQALVIDHMAKPDIKSRKKDDWGKHLRSLAANPNVYCKVSGMVTEADWRQWRAGDFEYYLDAVFESFGPERLMYGSDWPVCLLAGSYGQVVQLVGDYVRLHCPSRFEDIFGANVERIYQLKIPSNGPTT